MNETAPLTIWERRRYACTGSDCRKCNGEVHHDTDCIHQPKYGYSSRVYPQASEPAKEDE